MKNSHSVKGDGGGSEEVRRERPKKAKRALRVSSSTDIARRYMELRRLRAQISEAEASRGLS
jgi:hypothetical protein